MAWDPGIDHNTGPEHYFLLKNLIMNKLFDLRFVIGIFFLLVGLLLLIYSFLSSVSHPVNRWCGIVFIIFSTIMLVFSRKGEKEFVSETESGDALQ